jgi:hypothetical protein
MHVVFENQGVYEASIEGGLPPEEAEQLAELDPSVLETGDYEPSDIPALAGHLSGYQSRIDDTAPEENIEEYVNLLLEDPDEVISDWDIGDYPFENIATNTREKRDEYTIRTVYAFEDSIDQSVIDETLRTVVNREDYRHETAASSADGNLGILLGQYIGQIEKIAEDEEIMQEAYSTVADTPEASATAAANAPLNQLPEDVLENIHVGGKEVGSDQITTRLRKMQGAGKCGDLESRHEEVLMGESPTRNTSLVSFEGQIVGSLKYDGSTSMLALQDLKSNGRQVLQKGMTYRVSHPMLQEMASDRADRQKPSHQEWEELFQPERMDEEQEEYQDWEVKEVDRLELRPLRFAGEQGDHTVDGFRERIETRREDLEELIDTG